jgi:hypothetical protein
MISPKEDLPWKELAFRLLIISFILTIFIVSASLLIDPSNLNTTDSQVFNLALIVLPIITIAIACLATIKKMGTSIPEDGSMPKRDLVFIVLYIIYSTIVIILNILSMRHALIGTAY